MDMADAQAITRIADPGRVTFLAAVVLVGSVRTSLPLKTG
jgi:hypothetical protein